MVEDLTANDIETLRRISSPTISNAVELFNIRPRTQGYSNSSIRCLFPELGTMVGYSTTATVSADEPSRVDLAGEYWESVLRIPPPRIAVLRDLNNPPVGAFWGEVNASIHKALGCVGTVIEGGVRDLDEVKALGFHYFASHVIVSHGYVHIEDFGKPVSVEGLMVKPGDLLHADKHGVVTIPAEIAKRVVAAARVIELHEREIIEYCKSTNFTLEKLKQLRKEFREKIQKERF